MVTDDTKFQILYDHYKDSFTQLLSHIKRRDRQFFYIIIVIIIMSFQIAFPKESGEAISQFVSGRLELDSPLNTSFIGSIIWFGLLSLVVRYFQEVVHIERQYKYIHMLEEQISLNYEGKVFTRESEWYLEDYPKYSSWTSAIYIYIFPAFLIFVVVYKIFNELLPLGDYSITIIINSLIALIILISIILYLVMLHFKK